MACGIWSLSGHPRSDGSPEAGSSDARWGREQRPVNTQAPAHGTNSAAPPLTGPTWAAGAGRAQTPASTLVRLLIQRNRTDVNSGPTSQTTPTDTRPRELPTPPPASPRPTDSPPRSTLPSEACPSWTLHLASQLLLESSQSASWAPGPRHAPARLLPLQHHYLHSAARSFRRTTNAHLTSKCGISSVCATHCAGITWEKGTDRVPT